LLLIGHHCDILSDLCAGLVGGLGLAPGANYGPGVAVFEASHGTVPARAGCDMANPMALILSGAQLLHHLGESEAGQRVEAAVGSVLAEGRVLTYDLAGPLGIDPSPTSALAREIAARV
jgi:isocitrate dehydrogenase (NAD+)